MTVFIRWVPCPACAGTCRVWTTYKGANVRVLVPCWDCVCGRVMRKLTRAEVLEALGPEPDTERMLPAALPAE